MITSGKLFKIKPEWTDSEAEQSLVYEVVSDMGSYILGTVNGNPAGFRFPPIESFDLDMISFL